MTGINQVLFPPTSSWVAHKKFPTHIIGEETIAVDIESKDPNLLSKGPGFIRGDAAVVGVSLATKTEQWYFPFGHASGGNMSMAHVKRFVNDVLTQAKWLIGANIKYDLEGLIYGLEVDESILNKQIFDIQIAEPLIDEESPVGFSLNALSLKYLKRPKDETLLKEAANSYGVDPKGEMWKLHAKYVGQYAEIDARNTFDVAEHQLAELTRQNLLDVFELEGKLLSVLFRMRANGINIDMPRASELSSKFEQEEKDLRQTFSGTYNVSPLFDIWSSQKIAQLAKTCGILDQDIPRTDKGNPSFEGDWLERQTDSVFSDIAKLREVNRLRTVFIDQWIFNNVIDGSIHPEWQQLRSNRGGTRTGRLACSNPNAQQIPSKRHRDGSPNPIGEAIRTLFIPNEGEQWAKLDYSQQEPKILLHFAILSKLQGADKMGQQYKDDPSTDFYQYLVDAAGITRRQAKDMTLGRMYGMGEKTMAERLEKSVDECKMLLNKFDREIPFISQIDERCRALAVTRGWVKTLSGRRRHFNLWLPQYAKDKSPVDLESAKRLWPNSVLQRAYTQKALNALIQGSAADMTKKSIVDIYEKLGLVPIMQVHDELNYSVESEEQAREIKSCMEQCYDMCVPIKADLDLGPHWK